MENIIKNLQYKVQVVISIICCTCCSCSDSLDVVPKDQVSDAVLWENETNADLFLHNIYADLFSLYNADDHWGENFSDNAVGNYAFQYSVNTFSLAGYTSQNGPNVWGLYSSIRKTNLFIEKVSEKDFPKEWKDVRIGEAKFLRAYFYSYLWCYYGGVPIITKVLNQSMGDAIFFERATFDVTFEFIVEELASIVPLLPLNAESGRASKGAALALKGWCELFAASPLNNPDNNREKWEQSSRTYRELMDLGKYDLFPDYSKLFLEENNDNMEDIFHRAYYSNNTITAAQGPAYVGSVLRGHASSLPTQELVDSYVMSNGLPITNPASGYDPQNPYEGREKRFYCDIIYDGSEWAGEKMVMKQGVGSRNATDISNTTEATNTGYYWRKGMDPKYAFVGNGQNSAHVMIFRYAEVLLGYAEAENEVNGPTPSVYEAINRVRSRVELPPLSEGMSQSEMRITIHRERRVELAWEGKRWLDLIRLKQAEDKLNGFLHAVIIEKSNSKDEWLYKYEPAAGGERKFYSEKNYRFPIPQSAIDRNTKLIQNPGYN